MNIFSISFLLWHRTLFLITISILRLVSGCLKTTNSSWYNCSLSCVYIIAAYHMSFNGQIKIKSEYCLILLFKQQSYTGLIQSFKRFYQYWKLGTLAIISFENLCGSNFPLTPLHPAALKTETPSLPPPPLHIPCLKATCYWGIQFAKWSIH